MMRNPDVETKTKIRTSPALLVKAVEKIQKVGHAQSAKAQEKVRYLLKKT